VTFTDSERHAALAMMRETRAHEVAEAHGRRMYFVWLDSTSWTVQAPDIERAKAIVKFTEGLHAGGIWEPRGELRVDPPLTWAEARRLLIRYEGQKVSALTFFTGLEDAVIACSEWDD
jgi:hypothetical protein